MIAEFYPVLSTGQMKFEPSDSSFNCFEFLDELTGFQFKTSSIIRDEGLRGLEVCFVVQTGHNLARGTEEVGSLKTRRPVIVHFCDRLLLILIISRRIQRFQIFFLVRSSLRHTLFRYID